MTRRFPMPFGVIAVAALMAFAAPASADEIEDSISTALEAYQSGDIAAAKGEIDYVAQLLSQKQAASLGTILPAPFDGWTQEMTGSEAAAGMAMFGGGLSAGADYRRDNDNVEIQVMADSPLIATMMALFNNPSMAGATGGKMKRVGGQKVIQTPDGELQAVVYNRFMIHVTGSAPAEDKEAYFQAIDFNALQSF
ncbi:MAG: hypothetical protein R3F54_13625 [Alphaproteobacteria bacterium]